MRLSARSTRRDGTARRDTLTRSTMNTRERPGNGPLMSFVAGDCQQAARHADEVGMVAVQQDALPYPVAVVDSRPVRAAAASRAARAR